jgi:hypothetical protein
LKLDSDIARLHDLDEVLIADLPTSTKSDNKKRKRAGDTDAVVSSRCSSGRYRNALVLRICEKLVLLGAMQHIQPRCYS